MIDNREITLLEQMLEYARKSGAQKAKMTLSKSNEDLVATLNGEVDKVTHCEDRSLSLALISRILSSGESSFWVNLISKGLES